MGRLAPVLVLLLWPLAVRADCIILLHGLARTDAAFTVMAGALAARGHQVITPGYPSTSAPIPELADAVLPAAIAQCGRQPVHFVAHSLGGILLRYRFRTALPARLGRVVMLGPPNQGSQLVDELGGWTVFGLLNGPAGRQLGTGPDSWPRRLPPVGYPVGVIAGSRTLNPLFSALIDGPDDGKVSVASTVVAGMAGHITLPVTHTFMMNNPRVIAETLHFLETGRFDPAISWLDAVTGRVETACGSRADRAAGSGSPGR